MERGTKFPPERYTFHRSRHLKTGLLATGAAAAVLLTQLGCLGAGGCSRCGACWSAVPFIGAGALWIGGWLRR